MTRRGCRSLCIAAALSCLASPSVAEVPLELFAQQPIMDKPRLSPDGTSIAFLSSLNGRNHVVIEQFTPEFSRSVIAPGDDFEFDWVRWASDERLVFAASYAARRYSMAITHTRLLSVNRSGQDLQSIILPATFKKLGSRIPEEHPPARLQHRVVHWLPDDPDHILVALDADHNDAIEVRKVNVHNGEFEVVVRDFAGWQTWIADSSGDVRVGLSYGDDERVLTVKDTDGMWHESLRKPWLDDGLVPVDFTVDDQLLVVGPNESGVAAAYTVDLDTDEITATLFEHERVDVNGIVDDGRNGNAAGVAYTEHLPVTAYFDESLATLGRTIDKAVPGATNQIINTSTGRRQILIRSSTDTNPGSYLVWDRDNGSLSHYSDRYADFSDDMLSPVAPVSFEARDGWQIPAYLTTPRNAAERPLPVVVLPHGGPQARDDMRYDYLRQFIASRGFAVFQPNFRGSSGYGTAFAEAGLGQWGGAMQDDVTDGVRWLIEEGIADPERICIVGWSYGGYSAAIGAALTPELYRCAASINGVLSLPRQILDVNKFVGGELWTEHMGLDGESSKAVSPLHLAERIEAPMLIVQTQDDTRIHAGQGRDMAERLEELGKDVQYVEIEFGGHSILNVAGRTRLLEALQAFLRQNLAP